MSSQDMPEKGGKGKAPMPWFKKYPEAYLDGTRTLKPDERGIYEDCLCLIYKHDRELPKDDDWIAFQMHVHVRTWRRVRDVLLKCGKLIDTGTGYMNARALLEVSSRKDQRANKVKVAEQTAIDRRNSPQLPLENNAPRKNLRLVDSVPQNAEVPPRARASDHQTIDNKEESNLSCADASLIDDDPHRRRRELSPALVTALHKKLGDEVAEHALRSYFTSDYAKAAKVIDRAFPAWVERVYHVRLSEELSNKEIAAEILAMCGKDETGKPDTSLPKTVRGPQPLRKKVEAA